MPCWPASAVEPFCSSRSARRQEHAAPDRARARQKPVAAATSLGRMPRAPLRVGGDVKPPAILERVDPDWSHVPKGIRYSSIVIIEAVIDESGRVMSVRAIHGQPEFAGPTVEAVRKWRFKAATQNGKPVPVVFNLTATPHFR
jgi:hypothetical protein